MVVDNWTYFFEIVQPKSVDGISKSYMMKKFIVPAKQIRRFFQNNIYSEYRIFKDGW